MYFMNVNVSGRSVFRLINKLNPVSKKYDSAQSKIESTQYDDDMRERIDTNRHRTTAGDDYDRHADVKKHVTWLERVLRPVPLRASNHYNALTRTTSPAAAARSRSYGEGT